MSRVAKSTNLAGNKVALLHVAKRDLRLADDDYRAILMQVAGVESAKNLTPASFEKVITRLTELGFKPKSKRHYGNRIGMATPSQIELIRRLWTKFAGAEENDAALNAWLLRFHQVSALRFVSAGMAGRIIPGLKAMAGREPPTH